MFFSNDRFFLLFYKSMIVAQIFFKSISGGISERHLINHLLSEYNPLERPVANDTDKVDVKFGITLQQIIDVDEKNQILISNLWLKYQWQDANLRWDPENYGGVKDLRISTDRIWVPDVLMYNSADERFDSAFRTNVVVSHTGHCLYVPPGVFKSTCPIDITWFPFDDQKCEMKFGSWSYDGHSVDLLLESSNADISPYMSNGEWVLVRVPAVRTAQTYECCSGLFVDITFTIHIKRRTLYYGFNLIIPCIILSSMTLLSFSLPPESGEKLHLGVTILLSMTFFLSNLGKILPATSDSISIVALYFGSIMVMVAVSVIMTVVVLNLYHRSTESKEMNPKLRKLLLNWLPRMLNMDQPGIKPPKKCLKKTQFNQKLSSTLSKTPGCCPKTDETSATSLSHGEDVEDDEQTIIIDSRRLARSTFNTQTDSKDCNKNEINFKIDSNSPTMENEENISEIQQLPFGFCGSEKASTILEYNTRNCHYQNDSKNCESLNRSIPVMSDEEKFCENDLDSSSVSFSEKQAFFKEYFEKNLEQNEFVDNFEENYEDEKITTLKKKQTLSLVVKLKKLQDYQQYITMKRKAKLLEILMEMRFITNRFRNEDQIKELMAEWRYAATVLDRLCLVVLSFFTILSLVVCFSSAPQLIV